MPRFGSFLLAGEQRDKITLTHRSTPAYNPIYGHFLKLSSVSLCSWANFINRFPKQTSYSVTRTCTLDRIWRMPGRGRMDGSNIGDIVGTRKRCLGMVPELLTDARETSYVI